MDSRLQVPKHTSSFKVSRHLSKGRDFTGQFGISVLTLLLPISGSNGIDVKWMKVTININKLYLAMV
jgi:hypothetical protein